MCKQKILDFLNSAVDLYPTNISKQHWKSSRYSYLDTPRPNFGLILILRGDAMFATEHTVLTADAESLVFLPKHSLYEAVFPNEADDYLVSFDSAAPCPQIHEPTILLNSVPSLVSQKFQSMVDERFSADHSNLKSKGLFYLLLDAIINGNDAKSTDRLIISQAQELLSNKSDISIGDIAKRCAVSESGLRALFKKHVGTTPTQYRLNEKLKQAVYLLESTDMSVNEISERLNFFDSAYFCKIFKSQIGMTPKQYSKSKKL